MQNEYLISRNSKWTAGKPNTKLAHDKRTAKLYRRAESEAEALAAIALEYPGETFEISLHRANVKPFNFPALESTARKAVA